MSDKKLSSHDIKKYFPGRVSSSACEKGSITVEAALAVPIFFLAVVSLLYLLEIMAIRTAVHAGLQAAGHKAAAEAYPIAAIFPSELENDIVHAIGAERLERSIVEGGSSGIHCEGSYISPTTGIGVIKAHYEVKLPLPIFAVPPVEYEETMRIKAWTGYEKNAFDMSNEEIVYVTETGLVYHRNYHCTYLDLSIHRVEVSETGELRNQDGGKYYPCEKCFHGVVDGAYITDTGNRYHASLSCSKLKRTVYAVPLSEAAGKGACSRCGR